MIKKILNIMIILLGNFLYAVAVAFFIIPSGMINGGGTGLALFAHHFFNIPIATFVGVLNIILFLLGAIFLGKKFALTTLLSTVSYPIMLAWLQEVETKIGSVSDDMMLCTICAGLLSGTAFGMVFQAGASTGGMDIPPLIISKYTGISISILLYLFDIVTLVMQMVFSQLNEILYGTLLVCIYSFVLEKFLVMGKSQIEVMVISDKYVDISNAIMKELDRGTTLINAQGGYSSKDSKVVFTVIGRRQLYALTELIQKIDESAFYTVSNCREVRGRGFSLDKHYFDIQKNSM